MDIRSHLGASLSAAFACSFGLVAACASTELPSSSFGEVGDEGRPPPSPLPEGMGRAPWRGRSRKRRCCRVTSRSPTAVTPAPGDAKPRIATSRRGASVTRIDTCELTPPEAWTRRRRRGIRRSGGGADAGRVRGSFAGAALPMCLGGGSGTSTSSAHDEGLGAGSPPRTSRSPAWEPSGARRAAGGGERRRPFVERCREARRDDPVRASRAPGVATAPDAARERTTAADGSDVALHNARRAGETCGGPAVAGAHAADSELRALRPIAEDEIRHAQPRDLHAWFMTRLDPAERRAVRRELRAALRKVAEGAGAEARTAPAALGLPPPDVLAHVGSDLALRLRAAA